MAAIAMFFWLGQQTHAPAWYFICCGLLFVAKLLGFVCDVLEKRQE